MRFLEFIVLIFLFTLLLIGMYILWTFIPTEPIEFQQYRENISETFPLESTQFYSNMRFPEKTITYFLSESCSQKKQNDFRTAIQILELKTILKFQPSTNPEITITCSNVAPEPDEEGHFIAGEGGPSEIINATRYAVITSAKIALYRTETCETPQVALHELLHALGFDHNSNEASIMYPITSCKQTLDQEIINSINSIYSQPTEGDLVIKKINAIKEGRYLNFNATISNEGLKEISSSTLKIFSENKEIQAFDIKALEIGSSRTIEVHSLPISRKTNRISITIETASPELSTSNNRADISTIQT